MNKKDACDFLNNVMALNKKERQKINIHLILVSFLFKANLFNKAVKYIEKYIKDKSTLEICCWQGILYYFTKEYKKASLYFEKAETMDNNCSEIKYFLAETYFALLDIDKSEAKYRSLLDDTKLKTFGFYGIGCCLYEKNRIDEAIGFFNKALQDATKVQSVNILNKKGLCLIAKQELELAKTCYEKCLEYSPDNEIAMLNMALTLSKLGDYVNAEKLYKKVLNKRPYDIMVINNLALCAAAQEKNHEAIEYCNIGLNIDPINSDLLINKGYSLYKLNDYKKALECFRDAEKTAKDDIILLNNKALCLMALENYGAAIKIFNKMLEIQVSDNILINKALCLYHKERYIEAIECLDNIKNSEEQKYDIYSLQAMCFEKLGDNEKAIEYYNKCLIA